MRPQLRRYVVEAFGTFTILFCGCACAMYTDDLGILAVALAFGMSLAAMTSLFLPISGAHFNPIVSLAYFAQGRLKTLDLLGYMGGQLVGSFAAVGLLALLDGGVDSGLGASELLYLSPQMAVLAEAVLSFLLVLVVLTAQRGLSGRGVSASKRTLAALAIGSTLVVLYLAGTFFTGPSLHPFRSLAAGLLAGGTYLSDMWVFLVGPFLGGGLAAFAQPLLCDDTLDKS